MRRTWQNTIGRVQGCLPSKLPRCETMIDNPEAVRGGTVQSSKNVDAQPQSGKVELGQSVRGMSDQTLLERGF